MCSGWFLINPTIDWELLPEIHNRLIYYELNYDIRSLAEEHRKLMSTVIVERRINDRVMKRVEEKRRGLMEELHTQGLSFL